MSVVTLDQIAEEVASVSRWDRNDVAEILVDAFYRLRAIHGATTVLLDLYTGETRPTGRPTPKSRPGFAICGWCKKEHTIDEIKTCRWNATAEERAKLPVIKANLLSLSERLSNE